MLCRGCVDNRYRDASLSRLDADPAPACSAVGHDTATDASINNRTYLQISTHYSLALCKVSIHKWFLSGTKGY